MVVPAPNEHVKRATGAGGGVGFGVGFGVGLGVGFGVGRGVARAAAGFCVGGGVAVTGREGDGASVGSTTSTRVGNGEATKAISAGVAAWVGVSEDRAAAKVGGAL